MPFPRRRFHQDDPRAMGWLQTPSPPSIAWEDEPLAPTGEPEQKLILHSQPQAVRTVTIECIDPKALGRLDALLYLLTADPAFRVDGTTHVKGARA